ncbi:hypothetical protein [Abditibacterium utsteinense]|uniref:hypothetical protein n=1 Tax=Abditibacterium utsteinense TaxID=1960156 RepID=UPI001300241E|nr:hypothetical protein [Abditibacterium utsteinense]
MFQLPFALAQTQPQQATESQVDNLPVDNLPVDNSQTPANSAPAASSSPATSAAGAGSTSGANGKSKAIAAQPIAAQPQEPTTLSAGVDVYSGVSNFEGQRRFSDGFWAAGAGLAYPSIAYLKLQKSDGSAAKFSLGTGDLYRGSSSTVKQPVEAWYQKPVGKFTATVGKYWVPFALQEWQYETKYGVQIQRALGASDFAGSVNYDRVKHRPNVYFRAGRNFSERANAGLSLAAGEGISYGSVHNKAIGFDASLQAKNFKLFSEFLALQRRSSDRFTFLYSKLVYDKYPRFKPFVAYYKWNDKGDAFGDFRSIASGATYQIRPDLLIEGGGALTADKTIYWVQLHLLLERNLLQRAAPTLPIVPGMPRPQL